MSDSKEVPSDVDGASCPSRCYDAIREAFEPFRIALEKNETDTLGRLSKDECVLFTLSGSWTGSSGVTLGDLRRLATVIRSSS